MYAALLRMSLLNITKYVNRVLYINFNAQHYITPRCDVM